MIFSSDNGGVGGYEREGIQQAGEHHRQRAAAQAARAGSTKAASACRSSSAGPA